MGEKLIATNRRAGRDYHILDKIEAGVSLTGTEVKSLRVTGGITLKDSYADIEGGELYLLNAHINPYEQGNLFNHDPERPRKLLLHKREIIRLAQRVEEKGFTLVPLRVYFKRGRVKIEIGVCRGKHVFDKREDIKKRESDREIDRALKQARRG
ncbi:MAG TPA: SsrA-binding protein SmpB [Candidatus Hydrogenedentes bacterium]|nr:SsrA-binding protein SmpB [Candidatus Hydrogenedentota bacterium]HNT88347.1 SsrA-binding protein SmpB [Candidatus Hydrogenedentota bacterium]